MQGHNDRETFSAPLLGHDHSSDTSPLLETLVGLSNEEDQPTRQSSFEVFEELKKLYAIALPLIVSALVMYGKSALSVLFLGQIGKEALAGGTLAMGIANITGYSIIAGLALGMEAITSQACGARRWPLMVQTLQRTITILTLASVPISFLWLYVKPILLLCGQDPKIVTVATVYLTYVIPDLFFQSLINPLRIYLRSQNITVPLMLSAGFGLILHVPVNYLLVHHYKLGVKGIAIAVSITDLIILAVLVLCIYFSRTCRESWQAWSLKCFKEWSTILWLAIPSCISVCLEWWWYELMIVLAGVLPNAADTVSAMGVLIQATALIYIFPSSLGLALSARVGNELGAARPEHARATSLVALACAVATGLIVMLCTIVMRTVWGRFFTKDGAILVLTAAALPVVGLCELGNCPQTTVCGALRGSARPTLGANINLVAFYFVGLPVAGIMCFKIGMGLLGLWMGLLAAQGVCAVVMVVMLMRTDWAEEARKARELTANREEPDDDGENSDQRPK
ncbi:hypothetical protein ACJRO7_030944 [Eucalyptus globulus]|uniref:Protein DETOXIFICATION n=2 Tax=Eucalyptus TaxID=3932 RepID=A0ABD3JFE3_EUCGL